MLLQGITSTLCRVLALAPLADPCGRLATQYSGVDSLLSGAEDALLTQTPLGGPGHGPDEPHHPPPPPPHPHYSPPKVDNKTIYQALSDDPHFTRIFKLVNLTESVAAALNDTKSSVTFFAPPDRALRPPKKHHKHHKHHHHHDDLDVAIYQELSSSSDHLETISILEGYANDLQANDDKDDEKRKEIFKKIIQAVLLYHILPAPLTTGDLAKNTTFPTSLILHDGSLDGESQRIKVVALPKLINPSGSILINLYANIVVADIKALNGIIHVVDKPLLPPLSAFQALFLFSDFFSTFTSAIQRTGLKDAIDWHWVHGEDGKKGTLEGSPTVTVFAPSNKAFHRLPRKLKVFLFSPFGTRLLKKLLEFHIVPDFALYTNWAHNATDLNGAYVENVEVLQPPHIPRPAPVYSVNLTLPTLLTNHSLHVHITQFESRLPLPGRKPSYSTSLIVNGKHAALADAPARNGVIHVVDSLLNPRRKSHHGDDDEKHHPHHPHGPPPRGPPGPPPPPHGPPGPPPHGPPGPPPHGPSPHGPPHEDEEGEWAGWEDWLLEWAGMNKEDLVQSFL
ncbi:FAS1 domain-containing protein [Abortiporus biennis]|nr:FAS1 domain-containing protein [Abortiporus biennis]